MVSIESVDGLPGFAEGVPGYELCPSVHMQAAEAGAQFAMTEVQHFDQDPEGWRVHTGAGTYCARAVIVATGTHFKALGLANEARLVGKGISHCASCDAPLLRDQDVVVVGGGDSALQKGLLLAQSASRVTVIHRGDALTGQAIYRDQVIAHPKINIEYGTVVEEVLGTETLTGLRISDRTRAETREVEAAGMFVFVGLEPATDFLHGRLLLDGLLLDPGGGVLTDGQLRSSVAGLFAAGTVRAGAAGRAAAPADDGTTAAIAADGYLSHGQWRAG